MKKILLIITFFCQINFSQTFKVDFDYAHFHYNDSLGYFELYYSFYQQQFMRVTNDNTVSELNGNLQVVILDSSQNIVVDKHYQFSSTVDTSDINPARGLTGVLGYLLPIGDYTFKISGRDINRAGSVDSTSFLINITSMPADRFSLSDIELAVSIKEAEQDSGMFYKNTYEVIPNPANLYGELMPVVYFYSEIYNLNLNPGSETLKIEHLLYNSSNEIVSRKAKLIPRAAGSIVEVGAINISKYPSGAYNLVVAATDSVRNLTIYSSKRLYVYNPGVADSQRISGDKNILSSEFSIMSEEELEEAFEFSKYVATNQELEQWKKLASEEAKRKFLFNFWNSRDKDLSTPENEYKRDYFNRVKTSNEKFSTVQKKGWKTDRGRVLITYGEPTEIERYPNQIDTKPHEIWQYNNLEGGVVFVFADAAGFNDYILIHSTMRGELRDDTWQRKIKT